jgi:Septum formation
VLSGVWVVVIVVIIVVTAASQAHRSSAGTITGSGQVDIFSLQVGDCFQNPPAGQTMLGLAQVTAVRCTMPHNAQVFAQFKATDATYPGRRALFLEAEHGCQAQEAASLDKSKITSTMTLHFLFPKPQAWTTGRRLLTCLVVDSTKDLTSSLLSAGGGGGSPASQSAWKSATA